jgi:hypothetical protein
MGSTHLTNPKEIQMQKWEYFKVEAKYNIRDVVEEVWASGKITLSNISQELFNDFLDNLGGVEGWELVNAQKLEMYSNWWEIYFFKRSKK